MSGHGRTACAALLSLGLPAAALPLEVSGDEVVTVVVLPAVGSCGLAEKRTLEAAGMAVSLRLDPGRYKAVPLGVLGTKLMALGEEEIPCGDEACWLRRLNHLGTSFAARVECMEVSGTLYVSLRLLSVGSTSAMAQRSYQAATAAAMGNAAELEWVHLFEEGLGSRVGATGAQEEEQPLGLRVALFLCEAPLGKGFAVDQAGTQPTAVAVKAWLMAHGHTVVTAPGFVVPRSSLGPDCTLDSTRAAALSVRARATAVLWLRAKDVELSVPQGDLRPLRYAARMQGRAYRVKAGRYGPLLTSTSQGCEAPVLGKAACQAMYSQSSVAAVMTQWEQSMALPLDDY